MLQTGCIEIDENRFEVRSQGTTLRLEPRVFDFVLYLARNRDRVVTRGELVERLWSGCHVTDAAVTRCAAVARKALGDPGVIVTVHRRGYRWALP